VNDSSIQVLELRGRDLENEEPLALKWDTYLNQHVLEGPANEVAISTERKAILAAMADDEPHTPKDIATALGRPVASIQFLLRKLLNEGSVDKVGYGKYAIIAQTPQTAQSTQTPQTTQSSYDGAANSERDSVTLSGGIDDRSELATALGRAKQANSEHSEGSKGYTKGLADRIKKAKSPIPVIAWDTLPKEDLTGSVREPTADDVVITFATDGEFVGRWLVVVQHTGRICAAAKDQEKATTLAYKYRED
jgi:hypothetical protein